MRLRSLVSAVALAALMTGCATFVTPVEPGMTAQQVYIARGNPSFVYPDGKGGSILEWATHEFSQYAYMAELDANGIVTWYGNVRTDARFAKIKVNGGDESPLYTFLKSQKKDGLSGRIKWNFTKFLINREGEVVGRFGPTVVPEKLEGRILELL